MRHFLAHFGRLEEAYPGSYPRLITRAEGPYLWDESGHRLLDAGAHLGACQVGHGRREIAERIAAQVLGLDFVALDSGLSHPLVVELARVLGALVPFDDPVFSFTLSGSEANELAFKIVRAYHSRRGDDRRVVILSRDGSYHGSSFAAMAATGAQAFRAGYGPLPPAFQHIAQPSPGRCGFCEFGGACTLRCADALEESIDSVGRESVAAVIAEPVAILQAVKVPHPDYWSRVSRICRDAGALLIVDEVVTGFGRTGRMFGSEHWDIRPDIMTLAKGLTSGYVPLGATVVSREVNDAFEREPLLHLNTYSGHPVACAAALANIEILVGEELPQRAATLEPALRRVLDGLAGRISRVSRASAIGLLSSIELDVSDVADPDSLVMEVRHRMYEHGVVARCAHGGGFLTVVFYPCLVVGEDDVEIGVAGVGAALAGALAGTTRLESPA